MIRLSHSGKAVHRASDTQSHRVMFRSFHGFDAFYCQPGKKGAHEKGGVEGEGGRRQAVACSGGRVCGAVVVVVIVVFPGHGKGLFPSVGRVGLLRLVGW